MQEKAKKETVKIVSNGHTYEFVVLDINQKTNVAKLILNRPNRANAFNADFMTEINKALDELEKDANIQ